MRPNLHELLAYGGGSYGVQGWAPPTRHSDALVESTCLGTLRVGGQNGALCMCIMAMHGPIPGGAQCQLRGVYSPMQEREHDQRSGEDVVRPAPGLVQRFG